MSPPLDQTRVIFMGSPDFALPTLGALMQATNVVGVVTQPDRQAGRGRVLRPPPVKRLAQGRQIEVIQPKRLKEKAALETLERWQPDLIVVAAFGQILRKDVLELPPHGCINVHASLLPRWRGAAPIQAAILAGDAQSGITIMRMDAGLDTGPILSQKAVPLAPDETAGSLSAKLAQLGADLLLETLPPYLTGKLQAKPQDDALSTYAPMLKKADGELDFSLAAEHLARQVRAYAPWPGSFVQIDGQAIKIHQARALAQKAAEPGELAIIDELPAIAAKDGWLQITEIQAPGKKAMSGDAFLRGGRAWQGFAKLKSHKETS